MDMTWFDEMEARIPKNEVRTRFAPSPTGYMHVGSPGITAANSCCASKIRTRAVWWRARWT